MSPSLQGRVELLLSQKKLETCLKLNEYTYSYKWDNNMDVIIPRISYLPVYEMKVRRGSWTMNSEPEMLASSLHDNRLLFYRTYSITL